MSSIPYGRHELIQKSNSGDVRLQQILLSVYLETVATANLPVF